MSDAIGTVNVNGSLDGHKIVHGTLTLTLTSIVYGFWREYDDDGVEEYATGLRVGRRTSFYILYLEPTYILGGGIRVVSFWSNLLEFVGTFYCYNEKNSLNATTAHR